MDIFPERTAKARTKPSGPIQSLFAKGYIKGQTLDYGGGKGADTQWLWEQAQKLGLNSGLAIRHYDPSYLWNGVEFIERSNKYKTTAKFDTVTCTYVLNVLFASDRDDVIAHIKSILKPNGKAYITVRADHRQVKGEPFQDGVITVRQTFQRAFTAKELLAAIPGSRLISKTHLFVTVEVGRN